MPFDVRSEEDLNRMSERGASADVPVDQFEVVAFGRYRLRVPRFALVIEIDRVRRDHHELIGELAVSSRLPGGKAVGGALSIADLNVSSARARQDRAKFLAQRSEAEAVDWHGILESFCQQVLAADRVGEPAIDLRTLPKPAADDCFLVEKFPLLRRNPTIIFGDGGTAKSYIGLFFAGRLAEHGTRVAYFDWELAGEDHRDRLERLFGPSMPKVIYARCERPLVYEVDRLQRIWRDERIEFGIFDSVAFACDGPPEAAEIAGKYFRAVREIDGGSLHIAHVNKSDSANQKPFGSTFWHNGARSTWFVKATEQVGDSSVLTIGLFNRKANLGALRRPLGFRIDFGDASTKFSSTDVAEEPELAAAMTIKDKMLAALRRGPLELDELADRIEEKKDSIQRKIRQFKNHFVVLDDGRVALKQRGI